VQYYEKVPITWYYILGWTGERSDVDFDGCSSSPCQNGGNCQV